MHNSIHFILRTEVGCSDFLAKSHASFVLCFLQRDMHLATVSDFQFGKAHVLSVESEEQVLFLRGY